MLFILRNLINVNLETLLYNNFIEHSDHVGILIVYGVDVFI